MEKRFFVKYLPVEGHFHYVGAVIRAKDGSGIAVIKKVGEGLDEREWDHVKLFLCSTDIQVGDKIRASYTSTEGFDVECLRNDGHKDHPHWIVEGRDGQECFYEANASFKVIGQVSSAATWVKEGDEYYYGDITVRKICKDPDSNWQYTCSHCGSKRECRNEEGDEVLIKGPCGHFH